MPSLKDLLDLMSSSWPVISALLISSLAILLAAHFDLEYLRTLPKFLPGAAFLVGVLSGSVLLVTVIRSVANIAMRPVWKRRFEKMQRADIDRLNDLPEPEGLLLGWAVANNTQVFSAPYFNEYVKALTAKGLLEIPGGHHHTDSTPFRIPDHIWKALKEETAGAPELAQLKGLRPFGY